MNNEESILSAITPYGVTPVEFNVLEAIHLREGTLPRSQVASFIRKMVDVFGEFSDAETEETVVTCLGKQWIKVLTQEDCERDIERWQAEENQPFSEWIYMEGNVDFTPEGAFLYDGIRALIDAANGRRPHDRCGYAWRFPQQVRFFSAYEDRVMESAEEMRSAPGTFSGYGESIHVDRIEGPFEIRPWWLNRFVQLPAGYRMDLFYTLREKEAG